MPVLLYLKTWIFICDMIEQAQSIQLKIALRSLFVSCFAASFFRRELHMGSLFQAQVDHEHGDVGGRDARDALRLPET